MERIGASSSTARAPSCDGSWAGWNKSNSTWTSAGASSTQKSSGRREVVRAAKGQKWSERWAYDDWTWQDGSWNDSTGEWQDNSGRWNAWDSTQVTAPPERPNGNANWEDVKVIYILMEGPINFSIFLFDYIDYIETRTQQQGKHWHGLAKDKHWWMSETERFANA